MDIARRIKPAHLDLVLKIAETQQLQLAAQAVAISQPAASRILAEIETNIGSPLFVRHPKGMVMSQAGEVFVRHARVILAEVRTLEDELRHIQSGDLGEVRVGSVTGPAVGVLMPAVQAVQQDSPDLEISVDVAPSRVLIRDLEEGRYDFVLGRIPPGHDSRLFRVHPARTEVVALLVHDTHPLASRQDVEVSELTGYPWVMQERGMPIRESVEAAFHTAGVAIPPRVLNSSSLLVALAQVARVQAIVPQSNEVKELLVHSDIGASLTALQLRRSIVVPPYFVLRDGSRKLSRAAERLLQEVLARI
ncbi:DNA-binding transcriptional regulator, LysR family [Mameliella alba]|jgi:DNA-binding transcriptional LysR family regulator|uniref:LysR substrate-binding domain-containing protein n=1 Tax=Mameliella alba TaxID=561184 RepID=UPI000880F335|nr:LysR substrate-binding domain-containing protein [Mameliella alba]OWV47413.1 transcriptional regulator [Mameliella alba]PTR38259.1 DNA-binding transcriptional LysR family regulator [Mameliella alba]GGF57760.1 LysR family transcriptional regulator [Mameliella alba]SDC78650.1 DNA-binding transcriptional regulator, LysR family [Mameliella alba]